MFSRLLTLECTTQFFHVGGVLSNMTPLQASAGHVPGLGDVLLLRHRQLSPNEHRLRQSPGGKRVLKVTWHHRGPRIAKIMPQNKVRRLTRPNGRASRGFLWASRTPSRSLSGQRHLRCGLPGVVIGVREPSALGAVCSHAPGALSDSVVRAQGRHRDAGPVRERGRETALPEAASAKN